MKKFAIRIAVYVIGSIVLDTISAGIENKKNGKTIFGNKPRPKRNTTVDTRTNYIWLGTKDYVIGEAA